MIKLTFSARFAIVLVLMLIENPFLTAKPIDTKAAEEFLKLGKLISPGAKRTIPEASYIKMAMEDNSDLRLCAALALAFGEEADGFVALQQLSKVNDVVVAGAASYAIKLRSCDRRGAAATLNSLCFWLGRSTNAYERMFLANRIAVDFGATSLRVILDAAKSESDEIVQCDMLFYLVGSQDMELSKEIEDFSWHENVALPPNIAFIMGSITPGRSKSVEDNSVFLLKKKNRQLLKKVKTP